MVNYQLLAVITELAQWGTPSCIRPQPATDNGVRGGRSNLLVAHPTLVGSTSWGRRIARCNRGSNSRPRLRQTNALPVRPLRGIMVFWLDIGRPSGLLLSCPLYFFPYTLLTSYILLHFFILIHCWCANALIFGNTLVHDPGGISYNHTEWHFLFPLFGARETKHAQRTLL